MDIAKSQNHDSITRALENYILWKTLMVLNPDVPRFLDIWPVKVNEIVPKLNTEDLNQHEPE